MLGGEGAVGLHPLYLFFVLIVCCVELGGCCFSWSPSLVFGQMGLRGFFCFVGSLRLIK